MNSIAQSAGVKLARLARDAKRLHHDNEAMRRAIADAVRIARDQTKKASTRIEIMCRILVESGFR